MHVQKLTNVPNVNLATSQSQQNDNYPTQPHNMPFATSQQNDIYPTQLHNMHFTTSQRNVIHPTQPHTVHFSTSQKFADCATSQPNVNIPVTYSNFGNFVTSGNDFNQYSTFPIHQPMYNEYPNSRAGYLDNRIPTGNENLNPSYGNISDIVALLPEFNPSSGKSLNSHQFVKRVNSLRNACHWDDRKVIFAVQQRMLSAARY